jgi:hypothetical protein
MPCFFLDCGASDLVQVPLLVDLFLTTFHESATLALTVLLITNPFLSFQSLFLIIRYHKAVLTRLLSLAQASHKCFHQTASVHFPARTIKEATLDMT